MAVVVIHALDHDSLQSGLWMCPSCKVTPGPLEPQDVAVWQRPGMTRQDALEEMVRTHNRSVGHQAKVICGSRRYLQLGEEPHLERWARMPFS